MTALDSERLGTVWFVTMADFLQRVDSLDVARGCIESVCCVADEYVFINHPAACQRHDFHPTRSRRTHGRLCRRIHNHRRRDEPAIRAVRTKATC